MNGNKKKHGRKIKNMRKRERKNQWNKERNAGKMKENERKMQTHERK